MAWKLEVGTLPVSDADRDRPVPLRSPAKPGFRNPPAPPGVPAAPCLRVRHARFRSGAAWLSRAWPMGAGAAPGFG